MLFTANVVSFFVGGEDIKVRRDLQHDIVELREEIRRLFDTQVIRYREELHRDVNYLRGQLSELLQGEDLQFRRQFQDEITQLRADIEALRAELALRDGKNAAIAPTADRR